MHQRLIQEIRVDCFAVTLELDHPPEFHQFAVMVLEVFVMGSFGVLTSVAVLLVAFVALYYYWLQGSAMTSLAY